MPSATTTSSSASTTCGSSAQYELPVKDAACGIPNSDKYKPYIEKCAQPAGVKAYNHDCALYAPAVDQSVQDLTDCLYKAGVKWEDVWCFGDVNSTATGTSYPTATVTATGKDSKISDKETSTATSSSGEASSTTSSNDAVNISGGIFSVKMGVVFSLVLSGLFVGIW